MTTTVLPATHPLNTDTASSWLVSAYRGERPDTTPVWFMRQAGRSLPEYRAAREGLTMLESCLRPQVAAEITVQPVRRHRVDAAIFFSDIMVPLRLAGVDVVILSAGTYMPMRAWDLTVDTARQTVHTNLLGVVDGVAAVVPQLLRQRGGAIAIVGGVAGYRGLPEALAYGPSKAALINFAETLYLDLAPNGVSVFIINPGLVATSLSARPDCELPTLLSAAEAARRIVRGFAGGRFEIHFPRRFTLMLKLLRCLPYRIYFRVAARSGVRRNDG